MIHSILSYFASFVKMKYLYFFLDTYIYKYIYIDTESHN